ncbi:tandem-95 repeat protein, partial [Pelolinea submarina]
MGTKNVSGRYSQALGKSLRILVVMAMLLSSIPTQFTLVNAATMEKVQSEPGLSIKDSSLDDEGTVDVSAQEDEGGDTAEDPTQEPTVEPTEEIAQEPTELPIEPPVEEPTEDPTEEPTEEPIVEPTATSETEPTQAPVCYALTLSHSGEGSDFLAEPAFSEGCVEGAYVQGEVISLSGALPDENWEISGWTGTEDDTSTADSNTLIMPAEERAVSVVYSEIMLMALSEEEEEVEAQTTYGWVAYNDCVTTTGQHQGSNVTSISYNEDGILLDQATGSETGVSVDISGSSVTEETSTGDDTNEGTDAYNTFFDYVDMAGVIRYSTSGWYVDVTFTNLDTSKTYTFATSANRASSSYTTRNSKFTISDITSATNESTDGTTISTTDLADDTTVFCTGYNTVNGFVARWTGITPGPDGDFTVTFESNSTSVYQAYGPSVFLLAEEASDTPTITTSGSLTEFNTPVGTPSAEQSYTVAGSNLNGAIVITAPDDFEVSTTSGSAFSSSVSLTPDSGIVGSTPIYVRYNPSSAGTTTDVITHASTGASNVDVAVSGSSIPTITVTNAMVAFNSAVGIASEEQSYTVSAVNLTDNLVISAPTYFEIADTSGGPFGASLSLVPTDGIVSDTPVYVRFNASAAGTYSEEISHTATGAATKTAAVSGTAGDPIISVAGALSAFSSSAGTASDEQSYTVSGSFLSSNITITAPPNFYISTTSGSGFDSTLTLTPTNGTVAETTIFVYFLKSTAGTSSGNITHIGGGAAQVNLAVSGTATSAPLCTTANLPVAADTYMNSGSSKGSFNYGGAETIQLNPYYSGGTSNQYRAPLLLWDLSSIPEDASITDASLSFYVTTGETAYTYSLYNMRRSWVEGSNDGAAGSGASWNYYDAGSTGWGTAGAANTSTDRYNTNLWDAAKADFGNTGSTTFDLNESGVEVIQGWLDGSLTNYGLTIQNYSGSAAGSWIAASSDNTSGYAVPTLNVTYCIPVTGPTITVTGSLSAFSAEPGIPSAPQTYTVSGASLTDDISVSAPSGFELSTDGTNYYTSLALTQSEGTVAETTVYVRMSSATEGDFSGNIEHTSSGAGQVDLAVSGTVAITPTTIIFQDGLNGYTGTRDTYIYDSSPDTVRGTETTIVQDINTGDERRSLLLFELTEIPTGATITSAELQFYVSSEGQGFNMYRMLKSWDEATISYTSNGGHFDADGVDAESSVNANWPGDDGYTGYITVTVPAATIEDWLNGTLTNNGWLMIATDSDDGQQLVSREGATQAQRPKLTVEYIPPSTVPTIATSGTLIAFSAQPDEPSEPQTYTVSGSNLTEDIGISAPAGFELSTDDITYSSTLAISPTEGTVEETTVYVRLASSAVEGTFSGNIAHSSDGAATKNLAVSGEVLYVYTLIVGNDGNGSVTFEPDGGSYSNGTVVTLIPVPNSGFAFDSWSGSSASDVIETEGVYTIVMDSDKTLDANFTSGQTCATVNLPTSADTWLRSSQATMNYGATTPLQTSNYTSYPQGTLMKWNLSEIPSTATVTGVSLTLNVTDATTHEFYLYDMLRDWVEGTNNGAAGTGASWTYYDAGTNTWGSAGAQDTITDRNDTNLWNAGIISSTGSQTFDLNSSGLSVVQGWIADSESNHGLTIQNYSGASSADYLKFDSREGTSAPTLNVTYCVGSTVTYTLNLSNDGNGSVTRDPAGPAYDYNTEVTLTPVANTGYEFSTWTGTDASDPIDNGDGTWSLVMDGNKSLTANFTLLPVNVAPDQPVLVSPDDDATGVITSPTLEVTVSDANPADTLDVNFYGREAGGSSGEDFTLIVIPDTQNDTTSYPAVFNSQMQWIADNKTANNIVFATHVGDIVNTASSTSEWTKADTAMSYLDSGDVNYSVGPGNHDIGSLYSTYFGSSRFSGKSYYQGYYASGNDNYNNYSFFSASGMDFIIVNLQYGTSSSSGQLAWADALLKANPDRRAIVVEHDILNINNSWVNQASYNALKDNPNLFLMLCGHMHSSSDGAAYVAGTGDDGHTIHVMLSDYQDFPNTGYLRILRFSPADDKIYGTTCTPSGSCLNSTSNYDQTELAYDMENGNDAFELIGTVEDVVNGSNASFTWEDLDNSTEYEWYATVSDGAETITGSTWSFTTEAAGTNHAPVLNSIGDQVVDELSLLSFAATAYDNDGNPLSFSLADGASGSVPAGASIGSSTGVFDWTPTEAQGGSLYTFDVCVSDGSLSDCETISVTVNEVNNAPVLDTIGSQSGDESTLLSFTATATDYEGDTVTFSLADGTSGSVPEGASIGSASGEFSWQPTEEQGPGTYTFDVCASDGSLEDCETITVTVYETNQAPVLAEITDKSGNELAEMTFTASATDGDLPANTLTYSLKDGTSGSVPGSASIGASSGFFSWTSSEAEGPGIYTFDVCVSDGSLEDCQTITLTISELNIYPVLDPIGAQSGNELESISFTATASDSDLPPNTLTFSLADGDSGLVPEGAAIDASSGLFGWLPDESQGPGAYTFDVCVSDGSAQDCETITVTVNEVNQAPELSEITDKSGNELAEISFTASATDGDLPANTLTFSLEDGTGGSIPAGASIGATSGLFSWTPTEAQGAGVYTFDVCVSDGSLEDCQTITATVNEVNSDPILDEIGSQGGDELENIAFTATASDSDLPANTLTFGLADGDSGLVPEGAAIDVSSGLFSWLPNESQGPGVYTFDVCVGDGSAQDCETIITTINEVNTAPVLTPIENMTVEMEDELSFTALATDEDLPPNILTFSLTGTVPSGAVIGALDGVFSWTPTTEQGTGVYSFSVQVCDDGVVPLCDAQEITVTVTIVNAEPVAVDDSYETAEDTQLNISASEGVLGNDSDADENELTAIKVSDPENGDLTLNGDGSFTYMPDGNFSGSDSFTYKANDGIEDSEIATVSITVTAVNDVPVADAQEVATDEDIAVAITLTGSDADGDTL